MIEWRRIIIGLFAFAAGSEVLFSQITGSLNGFVLDPSGAAVSGAKVTLTSFETGESREMETTPEGNFAFNLLKIGKYEVKGEGSGFRIAVAQAEVRTGEITSVQLRLEVGQLTETVTVTDAVAPVNIDNAQLQNSVIGERIQDLPVARDPNLYATIAPGVVPVTNNNSFLGTGSYNTNGGRGRGNNITVDNITTTDVSVTGTDGPLNVLNFADIKEVKLITNNFSAEYGRNASSQLIYNLKSGSNQLHGEVFYFFQNDKLNARSFFDTTGKANVVRSNDWGASVGGPVYFGPRLDLRNKLLWTASYEGLKLRKASTPVVANVPSDAMLVRVSDQTSRTLLDQYQLPRAAAGTTVTQSAPESTDLYKMNVKGDWVVSADHSIVARYGQSALTQASAALTFINTNLANFGAISEAAPRQASLAWTGVLLPTVVNELRAGFGRSTAPFTIGSTVPVGPRIQFLNAEVDRFGVWEGFPQGRVQNTYQLSETLTWVTGTHNVKFGADVYRIHYNSYADALVRGLYSFQNWDDFAAGRLFQYQQRFGSSVRGFRIWNHFYFVQDDWKLTRNLTLNLGFRLEVAHSPTEVNGIVSNLNLDCREPVGAAGSGPFGCLETGKPSFGTNTNPAPRLGFAYALDSSRKTVIRGGYGISFDFIFLNPVANQRALPPFIVTGQLAGQALFTGANSYANLVAGTSAYQAETAARVGKFDPTWVNFGNVSPAIDQALANPQVQQWNFGVERELVRDMVLRVSYVGTKGNFLQRTRALNLYANRPRPASSVEDETARINEFRAAITAGNGTSTRQSNRIDPRYNEINLLESSANSSFHSLQTSLEKNFSHGYMFSLAYTFGKSIDDVSDALNVLINDSLDQQDPTNNRNNRAVSQFDIRQRLVITHNWQLPWGAGLRNRALRGLLAGWAFSGISSFRSGFPVTFQTGGRRGVSPLTVNGIATSATVRPNISGDLSGFAPQPAGSAAAPSGLNNDPLQRISAYAVSFGLSQPLLGNFGTLGRNAALLNGQVNFDWQIYKDTPISESVKLRIGAEFYNIFNNTSFQDLNRNITSPNFGQYTTVSTDARLLQLQARLIF